MDAYFYEAGSLSDTRCDARRLFRCRLSCSNVWCRFFQLSRYKPTDVFAILRTIDEQRHPPELTEEKMQYIDIFELSRARAEIEGTFTAADLPEALSLLEGEQRDIQVSWKAQGTPGRRELAGADLILDAEIVTACVRCGKPVTIRIEKTVPFLFTKTEKEADAMPIEDDEEYEIVVGSRKFDLAHWVEEEIILSLPAFAQHDDCEPDREKMHTEETVETAAKPNPFACLAGLKTKK